MGPVLRRLIPLFLMLTACAQVRGPLTSPAGKALCPDPALERRVDLSESCTREQASAWENDAGEDLWAALNGAACYVSLIEGETDKARQLEDAEKGLRLAESAAARCPESGLAHYLLAYLTGLKAERQPLRALQFVSTIEREALLAAKLNPAIDSGGPDRMLGEVYLRAPGFPISIGDPEKATAFFRRAVSQAPDFPANRLGLVKALLALGNRAGACSELKRVFEKFQPRQEESDSWKEAISLLGRLCEAP